MSFRISQSRW